PTPPSLTDNGGTMSAMELVTLALGVPGTAYFALMLALNVAALRRGGGTMGATIPPYDLPHDQREGKGHPKPPGKKFTRDELRGWSLKVLALMASLTRAERERVLRHALKVNKV